MAYFCNGKQGICPLDESDEIDVCGDCEYFDGSGGREIATITNADHIRGMSDEELAKWLCFRFECYGEEDPCPAHAFCKPGGQNGMLDWLRQPYEDDMEVNNENH